MLLHGPSNMHGPQRHRFATPTSGGSLAPVRSGVCQLARRAARVAGRNGSAAKALPVEDSIDVVGLGNLCVDAVLPMEPLPPADLGLRAELLRTLTNSPPPRSSWEVGGNCNFMVAAARLGLEVASVGHIGGDVYGSFMDEILREEGVRPTTRIAQPEPHPSPSGDRDASPSASSSASSSAFSSASSSASPSSPSAASLPSVLDSTLICFVLVDGAGGHAFCSRYDFGPWPLLQGIPSLPEPATQLLRASRAVFTNGFLFDELPLEVVRGAALDAIRHGAAIFFDPGPRCATMLSGPRRSALDLLLDLSAVVLMTEEEARTVTGLEDPEAAARAVLARPGARAEWVVVKMGAQGALLVRRAGRAGEAARRSSNGSSNGQASSAGSSNGGCCGGCGGHSSSSSSNVGEVEVTRVGAVKVDVVDTVGCGDSFAAAIVMGFTRRWAPDVTLALACAVGGATATGRGAGRNVARPGDVLNLLTRGAAGEGGGDSPAQRAAFVAARERLVASLAAARERRERGAGRQERDGMGRGERQLSAAA